MFRHCPGIAQSLHRDRCSLNPQGLSDKGHFSRGASGSHKTLPKKPPTDVQVKSICRFLRGGWLTSGGGWVEGSQGCGGVFRPSACLCSCANSKTIPELQHNQELSARPGREGGPREKKAPSCETGPSSCPLELLACLPSTPSGGGQASPRSLAVARSSSPGGSSSLS